MISVFKVKSLKCRTKQHFEGFLESLGQLSLEAGKQDSQLPWPFAVPPPESRVKQFQTLCLGNTFHLISKPWQHPLDELRSVTPRLASCPCHLTWNAGNAPLKVTLRLSRWRPFPSPLPPCLSSPEHVSGTASSLNPC